MNHSIYSADRTTHLKIVVVALVAGIAITGLGLSSSANLDAASTRTGGVVKAAKLLAMTGSGALVTR
jgi:cytochrome b subunit of formate dehydrogenase